jgi:starch synthase
VNSYSGKPLRVLLLSPEYTPELSGGVGTCMQELADALCLANCEVEVVACTYRRASTLKEANKTIHLLRPAGENGNGKPRHSVVENILSFNDLIASYARNLIAELRPDVIHCQNWVTFPAGFRLSTDFKIPLITTVHYFSEPIERWWGQIPDPDIGEQEKRMFRDASCMATVSASMKTLIEQTYDVSPKQVSIAYNGMDATRFVSPTLRSNAAAQLRGSIAFPHEKIILFCGRLNPQKGISALLNSASSVLEENPNACLVIAGEPDSPEASEFVRQKMEQTPVLRKRTKLLGKLPRKQLGLLYQIADIAVVPSVYEPFGYAAIEAMAAAVPVIATAAGGLAEIVQHERTGILVPVNVEGKLHVVDSPKLASAQLALLEDLTTAKQLGVAGRQRVLDTFNLARWGETTAQIYRDAIEHF